MRVAEKLDWKGLLPKFNVFGSVLLNEGIHFVLGSQIIIRLSESRSVH
jgi:hypothetical protein